MSSDTLLIAPDVGLPFGDEEIQQIVNSLHPDVLIGDVTISDVLAALRIPRRLIIFGSHGNSDGIQLPDGFLTIETLVPLLRAARPECILLNTCSSVDLANEVREELDGIRVIGTVRDAPDLLAYVTSAQFSHYVATGLGWREAYEAARPGGRRLYIYLNGKETDRQWLEVAAKLDRIGERLDRIETTPKLSIGQVRTVTAGYVVLGGVWVLSYWDVREMLNFSWQAAMVVSLLLMSTAYMLFAAAMGSPVGRRSKLE